MAASHATGAWQGVTAREHQVSAHTACFDTHIDTLPPFPSPAMAMSHS